MRTLKTYPLQNSAILRINSERDQIKIDPEYQRKGDVWNLEKKQLLIDSILNDYDIPKLYFHHLMSWYEHDFGQDEYKYAVVDGRQRLEAIWDFVDGKFAIGDDFEYLDDPEIQIGGMTYTGLAEKSPKLKVRFDSFTLPIILVETDDIDLVEDMFSRLNEAVPLNAAEKRNAFGGNMAALIRELAEHEFFTQKVRFGNSRYQYREVSARLILLDLHIRQDNRVVDTKKASLDEMVKRYRDDNSEILPRLKQSVNGVLDELQRIFVNSDNLLRAQSAVPIFYLTARNLMLTGELEARFDRTDIEEFFNLLQMNRFVATRDLESASFELLEYDRLSQQGTNDASSLQFRSELLTAYLLGDRDDIEERVKYANNELQEMESQAGEQS